MSVNTKMTAIADEIRTLSGTAETMSLDAMATKLKEENAALTEALQAQTEVIEQISIALDGKAAGSEPELQSKTVSPNTSKQIVTADSGYDGLSQVTVNAMTTATQATPSISINSSGLITASATQTAGYVTAGTKSSTYQLAFQSAKTITPTTADQVAVSSGYYTGGNITVAAIPSSYVIPSGTKTITANGTYDIKNYASATVNVESSGSGGDTDAEDGLVTRTLTSYENSRVSSIGNYAFCYCSSLTTISFPNVTTIGSSAFSYCSSLTTASFPVATSICDYAFYNCSSLTSVSFPVATSICDYAFYSCSSLTSVSFPKVTNIGSYAFRNCSSLTSVSFPVATSTGDYAFYSCSSLTSVSFPVATNIGYGAFCYCSSLTSVSFPKVTYIGSYAFRYCSSLTSIYLTNSSVCTLKASNAFSGTSIWSTMGSIYVPSSLVASYKTATNWAFFSARIFSYTSS